MERQLDLEQSGQVFVDGRGPFTPEDPYPTSNLDPSTQIGQPDSPSSQPKKTSNQPPADSQVEVPDHNLEDSLSKVAKDGVFRTYGNQKKPPKPVEGTHFHIKASLQHVCSNAPFPNFYDDAYIFTDRTEFVKSKIIDLINSENYPNLDQIIRAFVDDKADLLEPLSTKFSYSAAQILFNFDQPNDFYYSCLTPHDCNLLRTALITKYNIGSCECNGQNCFDLSGISSLPLRKPRRLSRKSTNTKTKTELMELEQLKQRVQVILKDLQHDLQLTVDDFPKNLLKRPRNSTI
jgi:hypothetical protein